MKNKLSKKRNDESIAGIQLNEYLDSFKASMLKGMDAIKKAAQIYSEAICKHPSLARERFRREFPAISNNAWRTLEAIGDGDLNPAAFLLPNSTATLLRHIPIEKQNSMFENNVTFKVVNPYTKRVDDVPLQALTTTQTEALFDLEHGRVRTESEQRKILEARQAKNRRNNSPHHIPYSVVGNIAIINGVKVGRGTLLKILREMDDVCKQEGEMK